MNRDVMRQIAEKLRELPQTDINGWVTTSTVAEPMPTFSETGMVIPTGGIGQGVRTDPPLPKPTPEQQLWQSVHDTVQAIHRQQPQRYY